MARRGNRQDRDPLALGVALALHGLLVLGVRHWVVTRPPLPPPVSVAPAAHDEIDIDFSDSAPASGQNGGLPDVAAPGGAAAPQRVARAVTGGARHVAPPSVEAPSLETPSEEPSPEPAPADSAAVASAAPHEGPIDLGIGPDGWKRWVGALPPAEHAEAAPRGKPIVRAPPVSSTGGLQEGLEAHDRKLGIGPAGAVATALFHAAHTWEAPETGTAVFNVTVLSSGAVEVSLGETSDKRWQAVAAKAAEALRRSPPRIPAPREGYRLTLKITAEETMPNGLKRKDLRGAHVEGVAPRFHDVKKERREVELKNPTLGVGPNNQDIQGTPIVIDMPGVYVAGQGKVCGYRVGITPLGLLLQGGCDPANVGAKLQRVVRT